MHVMSRRRFSRRDTCDPGKPSPRRVRVTATQIQMGATVGAKNSCEVVLPES